MTGYSNNDFTIDNNKGSRDVLRINEADSIECVRVHFLSNQYGGPNKAAQGMMGN